MHWQLIILSRRHSTSLFGNVRRSGFCLNLRCDSSGIDISLCRDGLEIGFRFDFALAFSFVLKFVYIGVFNVSMLHISCGFLQSSYLA